MRPLRLDLEGFGTFRDALTLDFSDTDYFALIGSTGSGKTTVIDALCFALYGSAPRWPRRDQISLAMAPSESHTRVSFVFESAGNRYAAVRVLARAATGKVNTKQCRLVQLAVEAPLEGTLGDLLDAEVRSLAESKDDMEVAVTALLGLTWDHFIQCVVLPQGQFARFLHAEKRKRQDLLVELLGLSVYGQVGQRANTAAKELGQRAQTLAAEMVKYADATEEAESAASEREATLAGFQLELPAALGPWLKAEQAATAAAGVSIALSELADQLVEVRKPADLDALTGKRAQALTQLKAASAAVTAAEMAESEAEVAALAAGEPTRWLALVEAHARVAALRAELAVTENTLATASTDLAEAHAAATEASTAETIAADQLEHARTDARADELAHNLVAGENCPVCMQHVATVPSRPPHPGIADAEKAVSVARAAGRIAAQAASAAEVTHGKAEDAVHRLRAEITTAKSQVEGQPDAVAAKIAAESASAAQQALGGARSAAKVARDQQRAADATVKNLQNEWSEAGVRLAQTRDRFAEQRPPAVTGDHTADWATFTAWVASTAAEIAGRIAKQSAQIEAMQKATAERRTAVLGLLAGQGIPAPDTLTEVAVSTVVANAVTTATHTVVRIQERRADAAELAAQVTEAEQGERLNRDLGLLLSARNFERWMLEEALQSMILEASTTLNELSNGQFELAVDDKQDILVIDHNDASTRRPVQTLSGGETFQASLALALALSSQITSLSSGGGRLDTILLDEGFGSLDGSTLDVVAATLEQLSGGGERTVGLVTHVAALADRVPVRFTVTRAGSRSTVEKVWT
ncbi:AAA family ATPase [Nocardioides sp. URHA0020]|uniref:AAA family ATPase n=1 Tax=Nocardioides sp. URHA0020 TaxID=1380392 RepID=UPI000490E948|nr:SMC family ATPase [Nocardioides sp. URHA0020]